MSTTDQTPTITPETLAAGFSRRSMLRGMGVSGMGAMLAPSMLTANPRDPGSPNRATRRALAKAPTAAGRGKPTLQRRLGDGAAAQPAPYAITATSELSDEAFLTDDVPIQKGDELIPFVNIHNDDHVEALVLSGGNLSHLRRDLTSPTGWDFAPFDLQGVFTSVTTVAVAADSTGVYAFVWGTGNSQGNEAWLTRLDDVTSWSQGYQFSEDQLSVDAGFMKGLPLKGGISHGRTFFYWPSSGDPDLAAIVGWVATDAGNSQLSGIQGFVEVDNPNHADLVDSIVLYDTNGSDINSPTGWALTLLSTGDLSVYPQDGHEFAGGPLSTSGDTGVTELMWAWAPQDGTAEIPGYAFQKDGQTWFADEFYNLNKVADTAAAAANAVTVWKQNDLYTVNLLDSSGTLHTIQETSASGTGSWAPPIPLVPGLAAVFGVPTDPTASTLFAVGVDETLSVLTLDPVSGWVQTQVHQSGTELFTFAAYRVQVTVTDANEAVPGASMSITTDRPVGCWTPVQHFFVTPAAPQRVTADANGRVSFSIPAEELDSATLTFQAFDVTGTQTGEAVIVRPDADVCGFLGGTGILSDLGALTASVLTSATSSTTSAPLFGTLASLPDGQQLTAATTVVQALGRVVQVGNDAEGHITTGLAFALDVSSETPVLSTGASAEQLHGTHLTFSFGHLFSTIGHALRHGAAKLLHAVVRMAEDVAGWVVDLAIDFGGAVTNFTNLAINGIKDAFHVVGGLFQALGAGLQDGLDWLKHNVFGLLRSAKGNASQIQSFAGGFRDPVTEVINGIEITVDRKFEDWETDAHDAITDLKTKVVGATLGGHDTATSADAGVSELEKGLAKDFGYLAKVVDDAPATWLLHKFESYLPAADPGPSISQDDFEQLVTDLGKDWLTGMDFAEALLTFGQTTMVDAFSSGGTADHGKLSQTQVATWFDDLDTVVHDGLQLLDCIADTLLDLMKTGVDLLAEFFTYRYNLVASMGILGHIMELVGVDLTFSLDEILAWVVAFPATMVGKIRGSSVLFPAQASLAGAAPGKRTGTLQDKAPDGWQTGLGITAAVTQCIWGFADMAGDLQQFYDSDTGKRGTQSSLVGYFDIVCPTLLTVLLWPSKTHDDGSVAPPFYGGINTSATDWEMLPFVIWSALVPTVLAAVAKAGWTENMDTSQFPSGVQNLVGDYLEPFVQMVAGIINTVLGAVYSARNDAGGVAITGTVLGNLSFVTAPLTTNMLKASTEDVSVLVKLAVDGVANIGAAICIAEAASLPTP